MCVPDSGLMDVLSYSYTDLCDIGITRQPRHVFTTALEQFRFPYSLYMSNNKYSDESKVIRQMIDSKYKY